MGRTSLLCVIVLLMAAWWVPPAAANLCAFDTAPAASLLFPFVVFDYNNPVSGANTILGITNMSPTAQVLHVEVWSDYGYPIFGFNIVLSGYDVQSFSMRDILHYGQRPVTGTETTWVVNGGFPVDQGPISDSDAPWLYHLMPDASGTNMVYSRCNPTHSGYPGSYVVPMDAAELVTIREYLTASQVSQRLHNNCYGTSYAGTSNETWTTRDGTDPTWMWVTVDVVNECVNFQPDSPPYWMGHAMYDNVLVGDVLWVDESNSVWETGNAVHLETDSHLGAVATHDSLGNPLSFYYSKSVMASVASDYREPLPTAWAFRYLDSGTISTLLRVWKGPTYLPTPYDLHYPAGFYGTYLAYDCGAYTYYAWDDDEGVVAANPGAPWLWPGPNLLPWVTQEIEVSELNLPDSSGWLLFVWPNSNWDSIPGAPPISIQEASFDWTQTWMSVVWQSSYGSAVRDAFVAGNFNCFSDQVLPGLGVDYDYADATGYTTSPAYSGP